MGKIFKKNDDVKIFWRVNRSEFGFVVLKGFSFLLSISLVGKEWEFRCFRIF